jgi:hypothetical protein
MARKHCRILLLSSRRPSVVELLALRSFARILAAALLLLSTLLLSALKESGCALAAAQFASGAMSSRWYNMSTRETVTVLPSLKIDPFIMYWYFAVSSLVSTVTALSRALTRNRTIQ